MAADVSHTRRVLSCLGAAALALMAALPASAEPRLRADVGFAGAIVDGRFAPVRLAITGLPTPISGTLVAEQQVGNAWKGSALVRLELDAGPFQDGIVDLTLPIHDTLNPLSLFLYDTDGSLVASDEIDLRTQRRIAPFPVVCSRSTIPTEDGAVIVKPGDLSEDWWAYDGLSRLWLAAAPSDAALRAISQWVLAGGSLVLLTGADFYRLDSPLFRELLPISNPSLQADQQGQLFLSGSLKPSAFSIVGADGMPSAYAWPYGAGHVTALTFSAARLDAIGLSELLPQLPEASLFSLRETTSTLLQNTPVTRPSHLIAVLLVVGSIASFSVATRWSHARGKASIGRVLTGVVCLSVLSGFLSNRHNQYILTYTINTTLHVQTSLGFSLHSLATLGFEGGKRTFADSLPSFPLTDVPNVLHDVELDVSASQDEINLTLQPNELRTLRTCGSDTWPLALETSDAGATILNHGETLGTRACFVIHAGRLYKTPAVEPGTQTYVLRDGQDPEGYRGPLETLVRSLDARFSFHARDWLLTIDEREALVNHGQLTEKVRYLDVRLIGGDVNDAES